MWFSVYAHSFKVYLHKQCVVASQFGPTGMAERTEHITAVHWTSPRRAVQEFLHSNRRQVG